MMADVDFEEMRRYSEEGEGGIWEGEGEEEGQGGIRERGGGGRREKKE